MKQKRVIWCNSLLFLFQFFVLIFATFASLAGLWQVAPAKGVYGDYVRDAVSFDGVVVLDSCNEQIARFNVLKSCTKLCHIH